MKPGFFQRLFLAERDNKGTMFSVQYRYASTITLLNDKIAI